MAPITIRVVLGTGRLTIASAIGRIVLFWMRFGKLSLENFQRRERKKKNIAIMLIPLTGQCNYH